MQVELDAGAALFKQPFLAQEAALRQTGGKVKRLLGGKKAAGGDQNAKRGHSQVQEPTRHGGAEVFFHAVTGGACGKACLTKDRSEVLRIVRTEANDARLRVFGNQAKLTLGRDRVGDHRAYRRQLVTRLFFAEDGGDQRARHLCLSAGILDAFNDGGVVFA